MEPTTDTLQKEPVKIGVIVGAGTGRRLADIFKSFLKGLVEKYSNAQVKFVEDLRSDGSPYVYHSYMTLVDFAKGDALAFNKESRKEVRRLLRLTKGWHSEGVRTIFRTSINAEALYLFRQKVRAVKVFGLETPSGGRLLFVRDQTEGFYANTSYQISERADKVTFEGRYTRAHQQEVVRYALQAAKEFMGERPYEKWAVYKHHLFADLFGKWFKEVDSSFISLQPDNGLLSLYSLVSKGPSYGEPPISVLIICSNEVGDMIYEAILGVINIEAKLELYTRNIYCSPPFRGELVEYQTVHGSADDIVDEETIVPFATLRIAADMAEGVFKIAGIKEALEVFISETKRKKIANTSSIVEEIFSHFKLDEQK